MMNVYPICNVDSSGRVTVKIQTLLSILERWSGKEFEQCELKYWWRVCRLLKLLFPPHVLRHRLLNYLDIHFYFLWGKHAQRIAWVSLYDLVMNNYWHWSLSLGFLPFIEELEVRNKGKNRACSVSSTVNTKQVKEVKKSCPVLLEIRRKLLETHCDVWKNTIVIKIKK